MVKVESKVSPESSSCDSNSTTEEREHWSGKLEFFFSSVGYAVGLGNICRFPYLCYKNGGGAFLIPYLIFMVIGALPIYFLEYSVAQYSSSSTLTVWRICPLLKGVGYGTLICASIYCIYINIFLTWVLYFVYESFSAVLPWSHCNNDWNTDRCQDALESRTNTSGPVLTSTEEFWSNKVLQITKGIDDMGEVRVELLICLVLSWCLIFVCLFKGIKTSGKIVYVTATFPYVVLLIFLVRALTLNGAVEGLKFYLIPKWDKLLSTEVWGEAAEQIFYSSGAGWGTLMTFAGFNQFHHNVYRSAIIVPLVNSGTSLFSGLVTFSILGYMATSKNTTVDEVVTQGPGLAFVAYPEAISMLPIPQLWSVLFFLMLLTVTIDSQFGTFETITCSMIDDFPHILRKRKVLVTAGFCIVGFLLNLPFVMQGGMYVLQIVDWYSALFTPMIVAILESLVVGWIYGTTKFYGDIKMMIGYEPNPVWKFAWKFVIPIMLSLMIIFNMIEHHPVSYKTYQYPLWALHIGWVIGLVSTVPIPLYMAWVMWKENGTFYERIQKLITPATTWGPSKGKTDQSAHELT